MSIAYHGTNPNQYDFSAPLPNPRYKTLYFSTPKPASAMVTLNPNDYPMRTFLNASDSGHLNINYNNVVAQATGYYGINTGYGKDPIDLYAVRSCTGIYNA